LFGVLEVKDGLNRTGKKNRLKNGKNCMHWMHFLDLQLALDIRIFSSQKFNQFDSNISTPIRVSSSGNEELQ
jgi:hypothetical protein